MLMALGEELPRQVFGHPWLLQSDPNAKDNLGVKMSKSRGNVLYPDSLVDLFGVDAVRYFILHEMPFENDGVINYELLVERINSDLANTLGNLVNRTISMSNKYFDSVVTRTEASDALDDELIAIATSVKDKVVKKMEDLRVADAISEIFTLFKRCNKYIDETMPWALAKEVSNKDRLSNVLYNLVESISIGACLLEPFLPESSQKILTQLNATTRDIDQLSQFGRYVSGTKVTQTPEILFARLDVKEVLAKVEEKQVTDKVEDITQSKEQENVIEIETKPEITYNDFAKLQFQVGEIIACEEVKKSKKLLCSQVRIGSQVKQIVSGIKANYTAEEMVGKKVMVLVNLKPATLAGIVSEGMLLCAEDENGVLALMTSEKPMPAGAEIC
jgi:methionyl-tRNA synthetase